MMNCSWAKLALRLRQKPWLGRGASSETFSGSLTLRVFLVCRLLIILLSLLGCRLTSLKEDTLPEGTQYYFSIFGDSRDGNHIFSQLQSRSVLAGKPLYTVHLGDMISTPRSAEQWPAFVALTQTYFPRGSFFPVIGNHDVDDTQSLRIFLAVYPEIPETGYYLKEVGGCFCVFLNSESLEVAPGTIGPEQMAWLGEKLGSEAAQSARYRIVFMHRPIYPQNQYSEDPLEPQDTLHELFLRTKVNLVISGHEHNYSRTEKDGLIYMISGGAGSPLHPSVPPLKSYYHYVQGSYLGDSLLFRAIDIYGVKHDEFKVALP